MATREIGIGAILWANRLRASAAAATPSSAISSSAAATSVTVAATGTPGLRQAIMLGIAVDSLDALSAVVGYASGGLDWKQTLLLGGGGVVVAGWGGLCLRGVGGLGMRGAAGMTAKA